MPSLWEPAGAPVGAVTSVGPSVTSTAQREALHIRASRLGIYATIAALPLYTVRWHYGPIPTTLLETVILVTVAVYAIGQAARGVWRPLATPLDIPIVVLLVAAGVSVFVAEDHRAALGLYRAYFIEPVAVFYVAVDVLRGEGHVKRLAIAFAIGSAAFAVLDLGVFYRALVANTVSVGVPPNALYGNANYVAMYLEPAVAMATAMFLLGSRWSERLLGAGWLVLAGAALAASLSKGGFVAVAVLALVIAITLPRARLAVTALGIAAVAVGTQVPLLMARLATTASALQGREELFGHTLPMIRDHPIFGLGLGGYSFRFRGITPEAHPHDLWLTFWLEIGVVGMVAFAVIMLGLLVRAWRTWPRTSGFARAALWGAGGALTMWLAHGVVDSPYWKNDMSAEFWLLAAVVIVVWTADRGVSRKPA